MLGSRSASRNINLATSSVPSRNARAWAPCQRVSARAKPNWYWAANLTLKPATSATISSTSTNTVPRSPLEAVRLLLLFRHGEETHTAADSFEFDGNLYRQR